MQFRPGDIVALFGEVIEAGGKLKIRPVNAAIEDEIIIADPSDIRLMHRAIYFEDKVVYNGQTYEMMHVMASKIAVIKKEGASEDDVDAYALANVNLVHHADQTGLERLVSIEKAALLNKAPTSSQALPSPAPSPRSEHIEPQVQQIAAEPQPQPVAPASIAKAAYTTPAVTAPATQAPQHTAAPVAEHFTEATPQEVPQPAPGTATMPASPPSYQPAFEHHTPTVDDARGTQPVQSGEASDFADFAIQTNDNAETAEEPVPPKESVIERMHRAALGVKNR